MATFVVTIEPLDETGRPVGLATARVAASPSGPTVVDVELLGVPNPADLACLREVFTALANRHRAGRAATHPAVIGPAPRRRPPRRA